MIVSPTGTSFELVHAPTDTSHDFFENTLTPPSGNSMSGAAEECSTGITLAGTSAAAALPPQEVLITDLSQASFVPGSPAGTWAAPSQFQTITESSLSHGATAAAIAQGTHLGFLAGTGGSSGEPGSGEITAIQLPATSGSGTPAIVDYVTCQVGDLSIGAAPRPVTAYRSPNGGHAIALVGDVLSDHLYRVDLNQMLDPLIVPRTAGGHACAAGSLPASVFTKITTP